MQWLECFRHSRKIPSNMYFFYYPFHDLLSFRLLLFRCCLQISNIC